LVGACDKLFRALEVHNVGMDVITDVIVDPMLQIKGKGSAENADVDGDPYAPN
jgi:hypothetical protein